MINQETTSILNPFKMNLNKQRNRMERLYITELFQSRLDPQVYASTVAETNSWGLTDIMGPEWRLRNNRSPCSWTTWTYLLLGCQRCFQHWALCWAQARTRASTAPHTHTLASTSYPLPLSVSFSQSILPFSQSLWISLPLIMKC